MLMLCFLTAFSINSYAQETEEGSIPLILDTDGDIDDLIAIMFLNKFENINLLAITTTPNGKSRASFVSRNILNFLEFIGKKDLPVAGNIPLALSSIDNYPEVLRDAADRVMNIKLPLNLHEPVNLPSHKFLIESIKNSPKRVSILCTGPLTNLALALIADPSIKSNIARVYILGGAITVPGNILDKLSGHINRSAEYNMALDAKAAHIVLSSYLPITLIPLDALSKILPMATETYRTFIQLPKNQCVSFILKTIQPYHYPQITGEANFWGSLGVASIINPFLCKSVNLNLSINMIPGSEYGKLTIDRFGFPVDVCLTVDFNLFFKMFSNAFVEKKSF